MVLADCPAGGRQTDFLNSTACSVYSGGNLYPEVPKMKVCVLFLAILFVFCAHSIVAQPGCVPPEIIVNKSNLNIFSEQQEMYLGDVLAEYVQKNYRVIDDPEANRYVRTIGERLIKHLPPTNIKFQFHVVDLPELNAFASAGGRIYITRKMIAFVRNEDELAGIIGHELGHGIVRHMSVDMSRTFKELLGIDQVGDRKDIYDKFNLLLDRQRTKRLRPRPGHEDEQQLEADRIGLFAMTAAGYDPNAFATTWDRLADTKGKTGSAISDLFGTTKPAEKRLRELIRASAAVSPTCLDRVRPGGDDFFKWQSYVVTTPTFEKQEKLNSLIVKRSLTPALRSDVTHFSFSPDGGYVLAQDDSGISILTREPFRFVFRIDVADAKPARFTPDSRQVVFSTYGLRVEKWDIEQKKPSIARETYVRSRCWQTELSPDGNTLACFSGMGNLDLIDVATNDVIFRREKFYELNAWVVLSWLYRVEKPGAKEVGALQMEFSPDGRYFLGGKVTRIQNYSPTLLRTVIAKANVLAYDLREKKEIKLGSNLRNIVTQPFTFYSGDKLIGQHAEDPEKSGIFAFPSGDRIEQFMLSGNSFQRPHSGDYLFVRPTKLNPVGVFDLRTKKFIAFNKTPAMDGYGDVFISESKDGIVGLFRNDGGTTELREIANVQLPKSTFSSPRTVALSPDLGWLALSERSRGGVWNLATGEMKVYMRGFSGSYIDSDSSLYADFPKFEQEPRSMAMLNPVKNVGGRLDTIDGVGTSQRGKFLVRYVTKRQEENEKNKKDDKSPEQSNQDLGSQSGGGIRLLPFDLLFVVRAGPIDGTLYVQDARTRAPLWSTYFPDEAPSYHFDPASERVALFWNLTTKAAQNEIKASPALAEKLKAVGEKAGDYLVLILDSNTGKRIGETLIETGEGSFTIDRIKSTGDWLTIIDSENRVLLYSLSKGELVWRFFGSNAALTPAGTAVLIENFPGQLTLYDLSSGEKINELVFPREVTYAAFHPDGSKLFVLTKNQDYYLFNATALGARRTETKP